MGTRNRRNRSHLRARRLSPLARSLFAPRPIVIGETSLTISLSLSSVWVGRRGRLTVRCSLTSLSDVVDDALQLDRRARLARPEGVGLRHGRHLVLAQRRRRRGARRRGGGGGRGDAAAAPSAATVAVYLKIRKCQRSGMQKCSITRAKSRSLNFDVHSPTLRR